MHVAWVTHIIEECGTLNCSLSVLEVAGEIT